MLFTLRDAIMVKNCRLIKKYLSQERAHDALHITFDTLARFGFAEEHGKCSPHQRHLQTRPHFDLRALLAQYMPGVSGTSTTS
eukprot:4489846-Amphidinium_carterae.1